MAPKEKQKIEIEKTHRDPLLSFNQAVTVDCSDFLGTALIRGFNVAVNDSFGVGGIERVGDFDAERKQSFQFHGTLGDAVLQRRAFQKLHGDEGFPTLLTDVMDRADVGMIQCGRGLRFSLESGESMRIPGYIFRQELERHETVETSIFSFVDDSHPAATELFDDAVMRDGQTDHGWQTALGDA